MARPLLLGHRGARKYAPENTIQAFELALEHGCDGFEFDVRVTADRRAVVCHDPKHQRLAVASSTFSSLFERDEHFCSLDALLMVFHGRAFLNLEMKVVGAERLVLASLHRTRPRKGLMISSFLPEVIERLASLDARFDLGLICENRRQLTKWNELPVRAVMLESGLVTSGLVEEIRNAPLESTTPPSAKAAEDAAPARQIFVWTVNSAREMRKFAEMGVDGIISDDTKLLVKTLGTSLTGLGER